jgi:hypothetical protein
MINSIIFNKVDIFQLLQKHQKKLINLGVSKCGLFGRKVDIVNL